MPDLYARPTDNPSRVHECPITGAPRMKLIGRCEINNDVFKIVAALAIELMKCNMANGAWHPPLWLAFVSGPTGDSTRYNMQPTPQGITCTP